MKTDSVDDYLRLLRRSLRWRGLADSATLAEIESHLGEAVQAGMRQGLSRAEAERQALARFGTVDTIAQTFARERMVGMQYLLLGLGALAGLCIAYIDSRPNWDDTGITAGLLFLSAGLFTLLGFRRPWLMGLAVGIWLPAYYIFRSHDWMMLVVLLIPLAAAYLGWGVRWGLRRVFNWA